MFFISLSVHFIYYPNLHTVVSRLPTDTSSGMQIQRSRQSIHRRLPYFPVNNFKGDFFMIFLRLTNKNTQPFSMLDWENNVKYSHLSVRL